ncbi:MAG: 4Fe-4S binding protein [Actinomycetota bacterium]
MALTYEEWPGVEWVEGAGDYITIDPAKCDGCGNCTRVCLAKCFKITKKKAKVVNLDCCMECGACWYVCTPDAISFSWPPGGTGFRTLWG